MTLSPDVLAKLERSAQAVGGAAPGPRATSSADGDQDAPLAWDGVAYTRTGHVQDDTATGDTLPPLEVGPGWGVTCLRRMDGTVSSGDAVYGLWGVVYDETATLDEDSGESVRTLHLVVEPRGDGSRGKGPGRVDVAWPTDVERADPPDRRSVRSVLACAHRELARAKFGERRAWVLGVVTSLERVAAERGWSS